MRLRTAFVVWGLLAVVGWLVVLIPAYLVIDRGPALVFAVFGDGDQGAAEAVAGSDRDNFIARQQAEALGRIAPAAGGPAPVRPVSAAD